jgi:hypothetical protein
MGRVMFGVEEIEGLGFVPVISITAADPKLPPILLRANLRYSDQEKAAEMVKELYMLLTGEQKHLQYSVEGKLT